MSAFAVVLMERSGRFCRVASLCRKSDNPAKCGEINLPLFWHHPPKAIRTIHRQLIVNDYIYGKRQGKKVGTAIA